MEIRKATKEDSQQISVLFKSMDTEHYHFSDVKDLEAHIDTSHTVVLVENETIVGSLILRMDDQSYEIVLLSSAVKGGGRMLITYAERLCREEHIDKLWAWSLERYHAIGFYEKMGFTEQYLMHKQWFGENCYFFGKVISSASEVE